MDFELDAAARAGDLGFAQRQMVEILKALSRGAKLLVMDEPTSSLTVREEETLFAIVDQLKASGIGIVYISHRMADVLRLSDRISIVKDGRLIGPLLPGETSIAHIASLMSRPAEGEDAPSRIRRSRPKRRASLPKPGRRRFRSLACRRRTSSRTSISTSGRARLSASAVLSAADARRWRRPYSGSFPMCPARSRSPGRPVPLGSVPHAVEARIGLVPEDRRREGLVGNRSLAENFALTNLAGLSLGHGFGPMATGGSPRSLPAIAAI